MDETKDAPKIGCGGIVLILCGIVVVILFMAAAGERRSRVDATVRSERAPSTRPKPESDLQQERYTRYAADNIRLGKEVKRAQDMGTIRAAVEIRAGRLMPKSFTDRIRRNCAGMKRDYDASRAPRGEMDALRTLVKNCEGKRAVLDLFDSIREGGR